MIDREHIKEIYIHSLKETVGYNNLLKEAVKQVKLLIDAICDIYEGNGENS